MAFLCEKKLLHPGRVSAGLNEPVAKPARQFKPHRNLFARTVAKTRIDHRVHTEGSLKDFAYDLA